MQSDEQLLISTLLRNISQKAVSMLPMLMEGHGPACCWCHVYLLRIKCGLGSVKDDSFDSTATAAWGIILKRENPAKLKC